MKMKGDKTTQELVLQDAKTAAQIRSMAATTPQTPTAAAPTSTVL